MIGRAVLLFKRGRWTTKPNNLYRLGSVFILFGQMSRALGSHRFGPRTSWMRWPAPPQQLTTPIIRIL